MALQVVVVSLTALGLVVPFAFMVDATIFAHFKCPHAWIGAVLAIVVCFVQPILGLPDERAPLKVRRTSLARHSLVGKISIALSVVTIALGVRTLLAISNDAAL